MTEQEAKELVRAEVNTLLWRRIAIVLVLLGAVNFAALWWLFRNIQSGAQTIAANQAQMAAQKDTDEKLSRFTDLANYARSRVRDMDRDFSSLYMEIGKTQEALTSIKDARQQLAEEVSRLNDKFKESKAPAEQTRQDGVEQLDPLTGGVRSDGRQYGAGNGAPETYPTGAKNGNGFLSFGFPSDVFIKTSTQVGGYWVFSNGKPSAYSGGYWGLFSTNPDGSAGVQVSQGFPVEMTQAGGALSPILSTGFWDSSRKLSVDPLNYRLYNRDFSRSPVIDWSGTPDSNAALSFDGSANASFSQALSVGGCLRLDYGLVLAAVATPGKPAAGQIYFNTDDHHFYGYDGTAWRRLDNN